VKIDGKTFERIQSLAVQHLAIAPVVDAWRRDKKKFEKDKADYEKKLAELKAKEKELKDREADLTKNETELSAKSEALDKAKETMRDDLTKEIEDGLADREAGLAKKETELEVAKANARGAETEWRTKSKALDRDRKTMRDDLTKELTPKLTKEIENGFADREARVASRELAIAGMDEKIKAMDERQKELDRRDSLTTEQLRAELEPEAKRELKMDADLRRGAASALKTDPMFRLEVRGLLEKDANFVADARQALKPTIKEEFRAEFEAQYGSMKDLNAVIVAQNELIESLAVGYGLTSFVEPEQVKEWLEPLAKDLNDRIAAANKAAGSDGGAVPPLNIGRVYEICLQKSNGKTTPE
jgi:chromosome segregation ATPase